MNDHATFNRRKPALLPRSKTLYEFRPVLFDVISAVDCDMPPAGAHVRKIQPPFTPPNGTMGNCYIVAEGEPDSAFCMVRVASLSPVKPAH